MRTVEERARDAWATYEYREGCLYHTTFEDGYIKGDAERKAIDKDLIEMLINELLTSRMYHLGITGLDSAEEIARKEREGNTALIRGIDSTIKYVKEAMEE